MIKSDELCLIQERLEEWVKNVILTSEVKYKNKLITQITEDITNK